MKIRVIGARRTVKRNVVVELGIAEVELILAAAAQKHMEPETCRLSHINFFEATGACYVKNVDIHLEVIEDPPEAES